MRFFFYILLSLSIFITQSGFADEIYVYRNIKSSVDINLDRTRSIFDGTDLSWPDGSSIVLLIDDLNKLADDSFVKFARLSKSQFLSRWRIKFFSGRALIPMQIKSTTSAIDTLKSNPSAIFVTFEEISGNEFAAQTKNLKVDKFTF